MLHGDKSWASRGMTGCSALMGRSSAGFSVVAERFATVAENIDGPSIEGAPVKITILCNKLFQLFISFQSLYGFFCSRGS